MDQHGISWPIFYTRAFGENRSTLFLYALLPFQAFGGLNAETTRLPGRIGGILTVLLFYFVGKRLFGRPVGLLAAAFLAVEPWHVQITRWGHEAALSPLLVIAALAAVLWAGSPAEKNTRTPWPVRGALAGAIAGVACYGYPSVRLFLPLFLASAALATWPTWRGHFKSRAGILALAAMLAAGTATLGPLAWKHLTDPEINKRAESTWVWNKSDTQAEKIGKVLNRYPGHFSPDFLFMRGDRDIALSPPSGFGLFHWYMLPLMILGLYEILRRRRTSPSARVLLIWVVLYPIGDLLSEHPSMHLLRSSPGLCALVLLSAVGAVRAGEWLRQQSRPAGIVLLCLASAVTLTLNVRFLYHFFGDYNAQPEKYAAYSVGILEATQWLRPRLGDVDAVFCTGSEILHPEIYTLVGLGYDPKQWFRDVREIVSGPLADGAYVGEEIYTRYGKLYFLLDNFNQTAFEELSRNSRRDHVVFILRPGELGLEKLIRPVHEVRDSRGQTVLWIFDVYV
jgi:4-amino-4-deoxy-L-arabinose transferase-like glycosyltransferase